MILIYTFAWLIAAAPILALAIYSVEVAAGLKKVSASTEKDAHPGTVAILVPAHNEAAGIAVTVAGLLAVAPPGTRLLVVADNCDDNTAELARAAGAEVVERFDKDLLGKGYALDFGCSILAQNPPATVIVVDADGALAPGSVEHLAHVAEQGVPAQAVNLLYPDRNAPALVQISNFAFLIKNLVRSRGLGRLGRCALLTGQGMAFPWRLFAAAPLASADITEDLGLGIALIRNGVSARLVEQAVVRSQAASLEGSATQRRRWEHGFLTSALRHALPLLLAGVKQGSRSMISLGLHLLVPPLALLLTLSGGVLALLLVVGAIFGVWLPAGLLATAIVVTLVLTAVAWLRFGQETLTLSALLQAPWYVIWKLPLYLRFLVNRETRWQRTQRKGEDFQD